MQRDGGDQAATDSQPATRLAWTSRRQRTNKAKATDGPMARRKGLRGGEASSAAACCPAADAAREEALRRQSVFDDGQRFQRHACNAARPLLVDGSHHIVCARLCECVYVSLYFSMFVFIMSVFVCIYVDLYMQTICRNMYVSK